MLSFGMAAGGIASEGSGPFRLRVFFKKPRQQRGAV